MKMRIFFLLLLVGASLAPEPQLKTHDDFTIELPLKMNSN